MLGGGDGVSLSGSHVETSEGLGGIDKGATVQGVVAEIDAVAVRVEDVQTDEPECDGGVR